MIWLELDLQEFIDTYDMHAWIKMNKNDKIEEEEALSLFMIFRSILKLWKRGCMKISAAFRRGFFTEENF